MPAAEADAALAEIVSPAIMRGGPEPTGVALSDPPVPARNWSSAEPTNRHSIAETRVTPTEGSEPLSFLCPRIFERSTQSTSSLLTTSACCDRRPPDERRRRCAAIAATRAATRGAWLHRVDQRWPHGHCCASNLIKNEDSRQAALPYSLYLGTMCVDLGWRRASTEQLASRRSTRGVGRDQVRSVEDHHGALGRA